MMTLTIKDTKPAKPLADFVESYWMLHNQSDSEKEVVVLPDGRIDLFFHSLPKSPFTSRCWDLGPNPSKQQFLQIH